MMHPGLEDPEGHRDLRVERVRTVIRRDVELQLVDAGIQRLGTQRSQPAVTVGEAGSQNNTFGSRERHGHAGCRAARSSVKDVGGDGTAHTVTSCSRRWMAILASSSLMIRNSVAGSLDNLDSRIESSCSPLRPEANIR